MLHKVSCKDLSPLGLPYRLLKHFSKREKPTTFVAICALRVLLLPNCLMISLINDHSCKILSKRILHERSYIIEY